MTQKYFTEAPDTTVSEPLAREGDVLASGDSPPPMRSDAPQIAAPVNNAHQAVARGFGQVWGLHPGIALLMLIVDTMLFGSAIATLGASFIVSLAAAGVLGYITYCAQIRWYGDDPENARIKALIVAFLTAIPTPLPAFVYLPAGAIGLVHSFRRKS